MVLKNDHVVKENNSKGRIFALFLCVNRKYRQIKAMNDFLDNLANDQHQKMLREISNDDITPKKRDKQVTNDLYELKKDKINPNLVDIFHQSFEKLIISTIPSKDILSKKEIKNNILLEKFEFMENLNEALYAIDQIDYSGGKVVFGSLYIAKETYNFFDFSFDNGAI